jgi:hypothetical protein
MNSFTVKSYWKSYKELSETGDYIACADIPFNTSLG